MNTWNPWHGCHRVSEGCAHCYMYFLDARRGIDTSRVFRTADFDLPLRRHRNGTWRVPPGTVLQVGLSTDFFVEDADAWRPGAWRVIRQRPDVVFRLLTKRAHRIAQCLPPDWGAGYENVMLSVSAENQRRADERIPSLLAAPARHKGVMVAPFIGPVDLSAYLASGQIEEVVCDGERYDGARPCHYEWAHALWAQCVASDISFDFFATGARFVKDGREYHIADHHTQCAQAVRSGLCHAGRPLVFRLRPAERTLFDTPY